MLRKLLLALGIALGTIAFAASPASAGENCLGVHQDGVGTYEVCHPMP